MLFSIRVSLALTLLKYELWPEFPMVSCPLCLTVGITPNLYRPENDSERNQVSAL